MVDRNRAVGMGNSANGHGVAVPPLEVAGKPRHRGTRGVEFLLVGKLPGEPEGLAWLLEALRLRAWEEGTVREDTDSLAQVAGISTRSARRHLKLAIERGYLHEQGRVLRIDQEAFRRRDQALREAGCVRVKVFADILRDPDLKPVDRRIIAWVRAKGRGVNRGGGAFVLSREAMARELGIRASTLHDRLHALGDRLEHRWRRCADGRLRRTIWAQAPGQNRRPEWPESETTSPRLPWPESETTENQSGKGPWPESETTWNKTWEPPFNLGRPQADPDQEAAPEKVETGDPETGEARERPLEPGPGPQSLGEIQNVVEDWRLEEARLGQERLDQGRTALLLEHLGTNRPEDLHEGPPQRQRARQQALRQELLTMAGRVCCWGLTPDELATWLIRVAREYGPENLPAYLRRSSEQGDPGTLLRSQKRAEIGAGADSWRDYSPQTEAALEGPYATQVEQLLAGTAMVLAQDHDEHRQRLREELRRMVAIGNQFGAGKVLMQLVGTRRASDDEIAEAVGGALSVTAARTLLEFAA